ncbi:MAG: hypothetical protein R8M38_06455, partial [Mariprofundaceae bacterium]
MHIIGTLILSALALSACTKQPPLNSEQVSPLNPLAHASATPTVEKKYTSPLLADLSNQDISQNQSAAKQKFDRHWSVIAKRSRHV